MRIYFQGLLLLSDQPFFFIRDFHCFRFPPVPSPFPQPLTLLSPSFPLFLRVSAKHGCGFLLWPPTTTLPSGAPFYYHVPESMNVAQMFATEMKAAGLGLVLLLIMLLSPSVVFFFAFSLHFREKIDLNPTSPFLFFTIPISLLLHYLPPSLSVLLHPPLSILATGFIFHSQTRST